jgi:predicted alpha/beta hydrolase family esterase
VNRKGIISAPFNAWAVKNSTIIALLVVPIAVNSPLLLLSSVAVAQSSARIPVYEITTRDVMFSVEGVKGGEGSGYGGKYSLEDIKNLNQTCPNEVAIFVHGWHVNEDEARERLDRVKMVLENQSSLDNRSHNISLIGLSWHSDTEWLAAQFIAKWNGPFVADFITKLMDDCKESQPNKDMKIRLIGHSLGARVILSTLDSLHKNPIWNMSNFTIASVHLMGAAVDNEEVSMDPRDISDDKTNWGSPKSDYGEAIHEEVVDFYNLYSPKDNVLEPLDAPYFGIYPSFEGDQALGQSGKQTTFLTNITTPQNYKEVNVESQIPENSGINMTDADGDGVCDFGLLNFTAGVCHADIGDNHGGYIGFRDPNNSSLADDGAMDVVVGNWTASA